MSKSRLFACAALLALLPAPFAHAQTGSPDSPRWGADRGRNEGVAERIRPDYAPPGVDLGAIVLRPSVTVEAGTDSNIFYQSANETDDVVVVTRPRVEAQTTWSRHQLSLAVGMDDFRYQDSESEHHTDVYADAEGRLDILRGTYLVIGGGQARRAESRSDPDAPGAAAKPVRYEDRHAHVAAVHEFGRFRGTVRLERQGLNYKDAPLIGGGVADQDVRDYTVTTATGRLEFALSPDTALLAEISGNKRDYELKPPRAAFNRDSEGSSYLIGFNTDLTNLVRGEVAVGYLQQNYDDGALSSPKGLALDAKLEYFATPLTTLTFAGRRRVDETIAAASASSYLTTALSARIDHELRRNILVTGGVSSESRAFEGVDREDDLLFADVGARFLLNRRLELGAAWRFERQDSSGALSAQDYDVNRFVVSAALRF
jgi:hypothetical protein